MREKRCKKATLTESMETWQKRKKERELYMRHNLTSQKVKQNMEKSKCREGGRKWMLASHVRQERTQCQTQ